MSAVSLDTTYFIFTLFSDIVQCSDCFFKMISNRHGSYKELTVEDVIKSLVISSFFKTKLHRGDV